MSAPGIGLGAGLAMAAAVLVLLGALAWWIARSGSAAPTVVDPDPAIAATVERASGATWVEDPVPAESSGGTDGDIAVGAGARLAEGGALSVAEDGRASLRLPAGGSLRLAAGTRVVLRAAGELELDRGVVYFDSGLEAAPGSGSALRIHTPEGLVRDLGTQFEVRVDPDGDEAVRVRVREGEVRLESQRLDASAGPGDVLAIDRTGALRRGTTPLYGETWAWVIDAAPRFTLDGQTLGAVLDWIARETGWSVRFADPGLAVHRSEVVRSESDLSPDRTHLDVLPAFGLEGRLVDGVLTIDALGASAADG